jgi:hypothetical protein
MLKVTLKFSFYCVIFLFWGCAEESRHPTELESMRSSDSLAEARIDSAYAAIRTNCDTLKKKLVPQLVDSLLKDTPLVHTFFKPAELYTDRNKKVERVIRQLLADCDSSLQKETYRIAQQRLRSKQVKRKKLKA